MPLVNTLVYGAAMGDRLTKSDWIKHGLTMLSKHGIESIKVLPLAKALKVSRGSFYWHFNDLDDFRSNLIKHWRKTTTERVILDLAGQTKSDRLGLLLARGFTQGRGLDQAVRNWASQDASIAAVVAKVDSRRIAYIEGLLVEAGVSVKLAESRAILIYWAYLGRTTVLLDRHALIDAKAMEDLVSLFES